jgi:FkbM family methyltransferase
LRFALHRLAKPVRLIALPVLTGNGRGLRVRAGDSTIRILSRGEPKVEATFLDLLSPGDVVYDLGANIGWYSMLAARAVGPGGKVFAFEPSVQNAALAEGNARQNGFDNLMVIPAAVTDEDGWMTFQNRGSLMGRLVKEDSVAQAERRAKREGKVKGETIVPITKLDAWIQATKQPPPDVVKIDVEGAEAGVLRGMKQTLALAKPRLIVELHGTRREIAELLDSLEYEHVGVGHDAAAGDASGPMHLLARPRSSPPAR